MTFPSYNNAIKTLLAKSEREFTVKNWFARIRHFWWQSFS